MKYANFYDLESLTLLNRHEGCACSIKECDVEKVNRLISRMRQDRERVSLPTAGDVVTYITRGGDNCKVRNVNFTSYRYHPAYILKTG